MLTHVGFIWMWSIQSMLPGHIAANQQQTPEGVESATSGYGSMYSATQNVGQEVRMDQEIAQEMLPEVTVGQALSMVTEILKLLLERRTPRVEEAILEWLHGFQPPTFFWE
jgi:hypothetical protein